MKKETSGLAPLDWMLGGGAWVLEKAVVMAGNSRFFASLRMTNFVEG
jgi:hypothetical protein